MSESYACPTCHTPFFTVENADTDVPSVRIAPKVSLGFGGRRYCTAVCAGCGAATALILSRLVEAEVECQSGGGCSDEERTSDGGKGGTLTSDRPGAVPRHTEGIDGRPEDLNRWPIQQGAAVRCRSLTETR